MTAQKAGMRRPDYLLMTLLVLVFVPLSIWGGIESWAGPTDSLPFFMMSIGVVVVLVEAVRVRAPTTVTALGLIVGAAMLGPSLLFYRRDFGASVALVAGFSALGLAASVLAAWIRRKRSVAATGIVPGEGLPADQGLRGRLPRFSWVLRAATTAAAVVLMCLAAWLGNSAYAIHQGRGGMAQISGGRFETFTLAEEWDFARSMYVGGLHGDSQGTMNEALRMMSLVDARKRQRNWMAVGGGVCGGLALIALVFVWTPLGPHLVRAVAPRSGSERQ